MTLFFDHRCYSFGYTTKKANRKWLTLKGKNGGANGDRTRFSGVYVRTGADNSTFNTPTRTDRLHKWLQ